MKKIINFDKEINFPTMIGEITAISLDHTLKFTSSTDIEGSFLIKGSYKMTEATHLEEEFDYNIPVDIVLTETLERDTCKVEIEDFQYDITSDDTLSCKIDVLITGVEEIILESEEIAPEIEEVDIKIEELVRECDQQEEITKEIKKEQEEKIKKDSDELKIQKKEMKKKEEIIPKEKEETENIGSIFSSFKDDDETFKSYTVYILRRNDTLEKIYDLYNVDYEDLSEYNDLENIGIGTKIIIPTQKPQKNE